MSCIKLSANSICGSAYVGASITSQFGFTSESSFNQFIDNQSKSASIASYFKCSSNANLNGVQYQLSLSCASAVATSISQYGCPRPESGAGTGLCPSQCADAINSFKSALLADCSSAVSQAVGIFEKDCADFGREETACWAGTDQDVANCGFLDVASACALPANAGVSCCQTLRAPVDSVSTNSNAAASAPKSSASASFQPKTSGVESVYPNPWLPIGLGGVPNTNSSDTNQTTPSASPSGGAASQAASSKPSGPSAELVLQVAAAVGSLILLFAIFTIILNRRKLKAVPTTPYPYDDSTKRFDSVPMTNSVFKDRRVDPTRRLEPLVTANQMNSAGKYVSPVSIARMPSRVYRDPNGFFVDQVSSSESGDGMRRN
ncbi:hypothetical protein BJ741DRAFT_595177 [Chytriomyces cf. hyalinus JEL632]|nr:hypothetical protein BJ741DRAFT_595177 [Chytriomyces cf. hyalinus JEL632]